MAAPGRALLASPPLSPLWSLDASFYFFFFFPEFVGGKHPDKKAKQVNTKKFGNQDFSGMSLHRWILLAHALLGKIPAPEGLCQLKFQNDISEINLNFA